MLQVKRIKKGSLEDEAPDYLLNSSPFIIYRICANLNGRDRGHRDHLRDRDLHDRDHVT